MVTLMQTNTLNCVFITDQGYLMPTVTAITSLVENLSNLNSCYVHLIAVDLSNDSKELIQAFVQNYSNIIVHHKESESMFQGMDNSSHVSTAALFKFLLPEILPTADQVLYLDGDILINRDLYEYFKGIELGNHYVAAMKDINVMKRKKVPPLERLGAKHQSYFNSGVMLLNLKKMREEGMTEQLIEFKKHKKSSYMDQDAFNFCFKGDVLFLPPKINYLTFGFHNFTSTELSTFYQDTSFYNREKMHEEVVIYHFASKWKPWNYCLARYTSLFLKHYKKTPYNKNKLKLNYIIQVNFYILYCLKMIAPYSLRKAFEPSSRKASVIKVPFKLIKELVKIITPTGIQLIIDKMKSKQ